MPGTSSSSVTERNRPWLDRYAWDGCSELGIYGGKHFIPTQRPWFECFTPLYETGLNWAQRHARAQELLALVGLGKRMDFLPN